MFGLRWLFRRLGICPDAYYNYRKHQKAGYYTQKAKVQSQIRDIYHAHKGIDGYWSMTVYLARRGYHYSPAAIHKYMNTEMKLFSVIRPKKPCHKYNRPIHYQWPCHPHAEKGIGIAAVHQRRNHSAFRSRFTVYVKSIYKVL